MAGWPIKSRGLRMSSHTPVMASEVVAAMAEFSSGTYVDATLGAGGHSLQILEAYPGLNLLGCDRDGQALKLAEAALAPYRDRVELAQARFSELGSLLGGRKDPPIAILADLGVSSMQFDIGSRGFAFRLEGSLDMRMDPERGGESANDLIARADEQLLALLFARNGAGAQSRRYASAVIANRPFASTSDLAATIWEATPARLRGGRIHPATKVFQALRIAVNHEEEELHSLLVDGFRALATPGLLMVISYHSGEDREVKRFMVTMESGGCTCPPRLPCVCGAAPLGYRPRRSAVKPGRDEEERNPRSRSARMRMLVKERDGEDAINRFESGCARG